MEWNFTLSNKLEDNIHVNVHAHVDTCTIQIKVTLPS